MELDLDLSLSPHSNSLKLGYDFDLNKRCTIEGFKSCLDTRKLCFATTFGLATIEQDCSVQKPLLFSSSDQPNEEEEDPMEFDSSNVYEYEEENSEVVGWPPIKSYMLKSHSYHHRHGPYHHRYPYHHPSRMNKNISNPTATTERNGSSSLSSSSSSTTSPRSSMYVKVKMDGVAITRKVDIKLFNSYESLTNSLITMFSQCCDKEDTNYTFTFQGKEGDWLLPEDVPWTIFAESIHRISIVRDRPCAYTKCLF